LAGVGFTLGEVAVNTNDGEIFVAQADGGAVGDASTSVKSALMKHGGTMTGNIDMDNNSVSDVRNFNFDGDGFTVNSVKDEDDLGGGSSSSAALATQQSIKAYVDETRMVVLTGGFNFGYSAWTKVWIPLAGDSTLDVTGTTTTGYPEYANFIVPYDGTLQKVILRSEESCRTTLVGFHLGSDNSEMPSTLSTSSVEEEMTNDDTSYEFDFSGEDNHFTKGQIVGISVTPESDMNDVAFTVVFQMDTTT
jgi:hypothetical protein